LFKDFNGFYAQNKMLEDKAVFEFCHQKPDSISFRSSGHYEKMKLQSSNRVIAKNLINDMINIILFLV